jgi:hypothetical protein
VHIDGIAQEEKKVRELYDRTANICNILEEYERIHKIEKREEKSNPIVQDLKKRKKKMAISLRLRAMQEMKNL